MWRKFFNLQRESSNIDQPIAVFGRAGLAQRTADPALRRIDLKLAQCSPLERQQMRDFALSMKGWRGALWICGLLAVFTLCGAAVHWDSPGIGWAKAIVGANLCGILLAFAFIVAWFQYRKFAQKKWRLLLAMLLGFVFSGVTWVGLAWMHGQPLAQALERAPRFMGGALTGMLAALAPVLVIAILRNRQYEAMNVQLQRDAEHARLARELAESQLRLLRAQIEPHFLFNTLGAVQQLAQHGAPRAAELTANLIGFLRSSMHDMRSEQVSLAAEFGLVESYLKVMQVRLGERLRFELQLPRALEEVQLPSMILLTLVENAIKHGIEPALRGGEVTVSAQAIEGALRIRVRDGGVGMSTLAASHQCAAQGASQGADGGGTGLDNLRRRLRLAYGEAAGLALHDGEPGLVADVTIPHPPAGS